MSLSDVFYNHNEDCLFYEANISLGLPDSMHQDYLPENNFR